MSRLKYPKLITNKRSLTCFNFRFTPHWLMALLAIFFITTFMCLGFWQIERANEKTKMLNAQTALSLQEPKLWEGQTIPLQYQRIKVQGLFLNMIFLLDNQHYQHRFGYNVLTPLLLADGSIILIDRGWIPGEVSRLSIPKVSIPKGRVFLEGSVYFPSSKQWVLGPSLEKKTNGMYVVEALDAKIMSSVLQKELYPFIMRLNKGHAYGFICEWNIVSMPPQRHLAYALQWFVMALVILILFVALNIKRKDEENFEK